MFASLAILFADIDCPWFKLFIDIAPSFLVRSFLASYASLARLRVLSPSEAPILQGSQIPNRVYSRPWAARQCVPLFKYRDAIVVREIRYRSLRIALSRHASRSVRVELFMLMLMHEELSEPHTHGWLLGQSLGSKPVDLDDETQHRARSERIRALLRIIPKGRDVGEQH